MDKNVDKKAIAGVSLVEIMISLVLVAFALIAITTVFPNMMRHRKGIYEAEQANIIAMEALEFLQGYDCSDIASGYDAGFQAKYVNSPIDMGSAVYTVSRTGLLTPPLSGHPSVVTCGSDINTVEVYVKWTKSGKEHTIIVTGALR
ncbi:MAG: hypothetical protein LBB74_00030 [Chitinispirillales bacterium]|jgi:Tfp pilus assembly protein PilV|nr:hypothetical protein [Chitinispirillales bacterium]